MQLKIIFKLVGTLSKSQLYACKSQIINISKGRTIPDNINHYDFKLQSCLKTTNILYHHITESYTVFGCFEVWLIFQNCNLFKFFAKRVYWIWITCLLLREFPWKSGRTECLFQPWLEFSTTWPKKARAKFCFFIQCTYFLRHLTFATLNKFFKFTLLPY